MLLSKRTAKPVAFHVSYLYRHGNDLINELGVQQFEYDVEPFSIFPLFLGSNIQLAKVISHPIMFLFISAMCALDYVARENYRKLEIIVKMCESIHLLKLECQLRPVENPSINQSVLG